MITAGIVAAARSNIFSEELLGHLRIGFTVLSMYGDPGFE